MLRSRQFEGVKFKRQVPIPPYIVDFYCHANKLVIEIDGGQHATQIEADALRDRFIERHGIKLIRFTNIEVLTNLDGVAQVILLSLREVEVGAVSPST